MATHDYNEDLATATDLLTEFGSPINIEFLSKTPPDPTKPWRGPVTPDSPTQSTKVALAVQVSLKKSALGGTVIKKDTKKSTSAEFFVVPPSGETADYTLYDQVRVAGQIMDIVQVEKLQPDPGGLIVCYYVEVG